jgi:hypothetical protein
MYYSIHCTVLIGKRTFITLADSHPKVSILTIGVRLIKNTYLIEDIPPEEERVGVDNVRPGYHRILNVTPCQPGPSPRSHESAPILLPHLQDSRKNKSKGRTVFKCGG